jgi:acetyltransferase-like isoleucine patch superfamily enzyme
MLFAGLSWPGRIAYRFASWGAGPYKACGPLARLNSIGYIAPSASLYHKDLRLGTHVFIGDHVIIYQADKSAGPVELAERVHLHRDTIIEVGAGGSLAIGANTHIQPRCQFSAYTGPIRIGAGVQIAPSCAFYPYNHGFSPDKPIVRQANHTKGGIIIGDDAWLGVGVSVLDGVRIGTGAVIGAGSVVTHDVPDGAIAVGVPARVVKMRRELAQPQSRELAAEAAAQQKQPPVVSKRRIYST